LHYLQLAAYPLLHKQVQDRGHRENRSIRVQADSRVHQEVDRQVLPEVASQEQVVLVEPEELEQKVQVVPVPAAVKTGQEAEVDLAKRVRKNIIPVNLEVPAAVPAANQEPLVQVEALRLLNNRNFLRLLVYEIGHPTGWLF